MKAIKVNLRMLNKKSNLKAKRYFSDVFYIKHRCYRCIGYPAMDDKIIDVFTKTSMFPKHRVLDTHPYYFVPSPLSVITSRFYCINMYEHACYDRHRVNQNLST